MKKILICGLLALMAGCCQNDVSAMAINSCNAQRDDRAVLYYDLDHTGYYQLTKVKCGQKQ